MPIPWAKRDLHDVLPSRQRRETSGLEKDQKMTGPQCVYCEKRAGARFFGILVCDDHWFELMNKRLQEERAKRAERLEK